MKRRLLLAWVLVGALLTGCKADQCLVPSPGNEIYSLQIHGSEVVDSTGQWAGSWRSVDGGALLEVDVTATPNGCPPSPRVQLSTTAGSFVSPEAGSDIVIELQVLADDSDQGSAILLLPTGVPARVSASSGRAAACSIESAVIDGGPQNSLSLTEQACP